MCVFLRTSARVCFPRVVIVWCVLWVCEHALEVHVFKYISICVFSFTHCNEVHVRPSNHYDCICTHIYIYMCVFVLYRFPTRQQMWALKVKSLTGKNWLDDTEMEEEGIGDMLLDAHTLASAPRCVCSCFSPLSSLPYNLARIHPHTKGQQKDLTPPHPPPFLLKNHRPGTSLSRPLSSARPGSSSMNPGGCPLSTLYLCAEQHILHLTHM